MKITKAGDYGLEKIKLEQFLTQNNNLIDYQNINGDIRHILFRMSNNTLQNIKLTEYPVFLDFTVNNNGLIQRKKQVQTHPLSKNTLVGLENIFLYQIILSPPIVNYNNYKEHKQISIRFTI